MGTQRGEPTLGISLNQEDRCWLQHLKSWKVHEVICAGSFPTWALRSWLWGVPLDLLKFKVQGLTRILSDIFYCRQTYSEKWVDFSVPSNGTCPLPFCAQESYKRPVTPIVPTSRILSELDHLALASLINHLLIAWLRQAVYFSCASIS